MSLETALSYWIVLLAFVAGVECLIGRAEQRRSAKQRWPANLTLLIIASGLAAAVPVSTLAAARWAEAEGFGLLNTIGAPWLVTLLVSLLTLSLWEYLVHLASHKIPFLWRFHKIHHSDQALDVTTTYRVHPAMHVSLSVTSAGFAVLVGLRAEAVIFYTGVVLVLDLSQHTTLLIPARLDRLFRPFIITPSLHHIHHSDLVDETDSNFGHDLALWDRLFGTYRAETLRPTEEFRYGLAQFPNDRANDLNALIVAPFKGHANS